MLKKTIIAASFLGMAFAQTQVFAFPDKSIRMVVPYAAGGVTDTVSRSIAHGLEKQMKQSVVVENKPSANTALGAKQVATSRPDGYTILMATGSTLLLNPMLYKKLSYDASDLVPIALVAETPLIFTVNNKVQADSVESFIKLASSKEANSFNYASTGTGMSTHLAGALFMKMAGLESTHVPFNGSMPAFTNLVGGQVDMSFDSIATALPLIKDGRIKPIAVTTRKRLDVLPDIPTIAEKGYPDYSATAWYVLVAPKGTPSEVIESYKVAVNEVLKDKSMQEKFNNLGVEIFPPGSTSEMYAFIDMEKKKWGGLIQSMNLTLDK